MTPKVVSRVLVYPVLLLCGMALGWDTSPPLSRLAANEGGPPPPSRKPSKGLQGKGVVESAELRLLRTAEEEMFPELYASVSEEAPEEEESVDQDGPEPTMRHHRRQLDFMRGLNKPTLPIKRHARVKKYIDFFGESESGRKLFSTWLRRSGRYRDIVLRELRKQNLPADLEAMVFIESGFWPTAKSPVGALGMWQFMPKTARAYGLTVESKYDERRSIWRSTEAAAQHLADLFERFQSWELAIAAYNCGYERILGAMEQRDAEDFWTLASMHEALPRETVLYVPKVLAIAVILNNLEHFGFDDVELAPPLDAAAVKLPPGVPLSVLARAAGTSDRRLRELNPEIRGDLLPDIGGPLLLRLPRTGVARAKVMLPRLLEESGRDLDLETSADFDWGKDEFEPDGVSRLERARRPRPRDVDEQLDDVDDTDDARAFRPRRRVTEKEIVAEIQQPSAPPASTAAGDGDGTATPGPDRIIHDVQLGDSVWKISELYRVSRARIIRQNNLRDPDVLSVGRRLVIRLPPSSARKTENK